jgi:large subunit ribosomal protein L23
MTKVNSKLYAVLRRPLITEKSAQVSAHSNSVVFEVDSRANKSEIREAVEKIFEVEVVSVHTVNMLGKVKRVKAKSGRRASWKKAYVQLAPGSTIDFIEGL